MAKTKSKKIIGAVGHTASRIGLLATALWALVLLLSAFGGHVNPLTSAKPSLLNLGLPYLAILTAAVALVWMLLRQWYNAAVAVAAIVIAWQPISHVIPINLVSDDVGDGAKTLRVLSFNPKYFGYGDNDRDSDGENDAVMFILEQDADIVALQEANVMTVLQDRSSVSEAVAKQVFEKYPYCACEVQAMSLLSKYPVKKHQYVYLDDDSASDVLYTIDIDGDTLYFINAHLQSIGLNPADKEFFVSKTHMGSKLVKEDIDTLRSGILAKLQYAFRKRAEQADSVRRQANQLGENLIVCGDFNDPPTSWSYNTIMGDDMKDAYAEAGNGLKTTYHENRFWLTIDHILYRGSRLRAVGFERCNVKVSDHYPIVACFEWRGTKASEK